MSKYIKQCHPLTHCVYYSFTERSRMLASRTPESQWCTRSSPPTRLCLLIVAYAADTGSNLCLFAANRTPCRLDQRTRFADPCAQRATAYASECPTASCRGRGLLAPEAQCRHNQEKNRESSCATTWLKPWRRWTEKTGMWESSRANASGVAVAHGGAVRQCCIHRFATYESLTTSWENTTWKEIQ